MKKIFLLISSLVAFQICYATTEQANQAENTQKMKQTSQEGLKTAEEVKRNQQLWAKGKGNPKMAEAYQQGLQAAEEMKTKQQESNQ